MHEHPQLSLACCHVLPQVMGDSFVHGGGVHSGPPPYVDPEKLLSEPTLDPYIPFR